MTAWQDIKRSTSQRVQALDAWWHAKAGSRPLPDRADLDPAEISQLLPYVLISELIRPFRVRYRLLGTEVVQIAGMDFAGCYLDELIPAAMKRPGWITIACAHRQRGQSMV